MAMKNIDTFDILTGYILGELYESFPICKEINLELFLINNESIDNTEKNQLILSETLFWLRDNDFLTFPIPEEKPLRRHTGAMAYPQFSCIVLTAKGLAVLKKVPKSVDRKDKDKGLGEHIIDVVKMGTKEQLSNLVGSVLATAIKAL